MENLELPTLTITPFNMPKHCAMSYLFAHYAHQNWAMLLDSANSSHVDGRFDIMVADPIATLVTVGRQTKISFLNAPENDYLSAANPIELIQSVIDSCFVGKQSIVEAQSLPFKAGALGYFGYDLGRRFETLPNIAHNPYSAPDMAVGIYNWAVIKDNEVDQFYLCHLPIEQGDTVPSISALQNIVNLSVHATSHQSEPFTLNSQWQSNMDKSAYINKIGKIHDYLHAGDCYQVNLAQRFNASYRGDEYQAYLRLRNANQAPFSAFIRIPDSVIISISPERFLSVDKNGKVQSKPIKGTRPRSTNNEIDLKNSQQLKQSAKDQAENLMIVDLLRNDLSKTCEPMSVAVPALFEIESFAAVHHLVSTVTGQLASNISALSLLQGAFPGGSITGAPKIRAMEIIEELEPDRRNIYCGSIGYVGVDGDMDSNICIRTLLLENSNLYCWAGGGIVLDSTALEEYQESLDKVCKILPVLLKENM
ncbi:aminodeoxychorismate synthase component I [Paraglaciecola sp. 20A4]|uniref:aminodeoxychorismate synthase component I n=1 Tax=Paraglaciecola sp. 20A4 TaxID=2687288 RepID=UPI00140A8F99|nr:aminodeoxychorismate synthase component I [Paraglaciecola sp. 20A4]